MFKKWEKLMIKFLDLEKVNNRFRDEMDTRIKDILDSGMYLSGKWNDEFSKHFSSYCGTKYALGVANGLDAINLIIRAYGFGIGDEIIVPANTYIATILAISENGCTPVLVEPDINTYNINPDFIEEKITSKTKAIIVVHLYGQAVQMEKIWKLAEKYNLKVLNISYNWHDIIRSGYLVWCPTIEEYLGLIRDAEYVVTDSFHATAFSLIFETKFIDIFPEQASARLRSVLKLTHTENRGFDKMPTVDAADVTTDFALVHEILRNERKKSVQYMNEIHNELKNEKYI